MFVFRTQAELIAWAQAFGKQCQVPCVFYLEGDLGVGKTTFMRAFLEGAGVTGTIRSPTYTLVEQYSTEKGQYFHWDLYRLQDPSELEYLGMREAVGLGVLGIEWPQKGEGMIPTADLQLHFQMDAQGVRSIQVQAHSVIGVHMGGFLQTVYEQIVCHGSNDSPHN